jgi:tRNA 2-thiouridine synthesizing protein C
VSKNYLFIFQQSPYCNAHTQAQLDLALTYASLEKKLSFLFLWDGVYHLLNTQQPNLIARKSFIQAFKSLDLYDITNIYVDQEACQDRGLNPQDFILPVQSLTAQAIRHLLLTHDMTWR